jgi:Myosin-like coiled-coil protein
VHVHRSSSESKGGSSVALREELYALSGTLRVKACGLTFYPAFTEREVRKASRELNSQTSKLDDIQKIEALQKRCADLFAEMKRHERDNLKNKKRADQLQKEKDHSRTELSKNISLREKLEKLCRELQRENNRLKVGTPCIVGVEVVCFLLL